MSNSLEMLNSPQMLEAIKSRIPNDINIERYQRLVLQQFRANPKLMACNAESIKNAILDLAQSGLEPSNALGYAYFVPFKSDVKLIIGFKGVIHLALRSDPNLKEISAEVVYKGDNIKFTLGTNPSIEHTPNFETEEVTHAYAIATYIDGYRKFTVVSRKDLDKIRSMSASPGGVWATWFGEMAKKAAVKRLAKYLNMSFEAATLIQKSDEVEFSNMKMAEPTKASQLSTLLSAKLASSRPLEDILCADLPEVVEIDVETKQEA